MKTRLDLFTRLDNSAKVAEIGVMAGDFMRNIHEARPDLLYTGVDKWGEGFDRGWPCVQAYAAQNHNVRVFRQSSVDAAFALTGELFDLVYIDAFHERAAVLSDLKAWGPLVRKGGILAGHDYEAKPASAQWEAIEVKEAVDEWAKAKGLKVNVIQEDCPSGGSNYEYAPMPRLGVEDCPLDMMVPDLELHGHDLDRCPHCEYRNAKWEREVRATGQLVNDQSIPPTGAKYVFEVMLRIAE